MAYVFLLTDFTTPLGTNAGGYRYSPKVGRPTPFVVPYVTPEPGGGKFQGATFYPSINNGGVIAFNGIVVTDRGVHVPGEDYVGLGTGIYLAGAHDRITAVVAPGDPAPGGGRFDYAAEPWINDGGDVAFGAHVAGEDSVIQGFPPQAQQISALTSLYVRSAAGAPPSAPSCIPATRRPAAARFRQVFHSIMNNRGDIAFAGDLTPPPRAQQSVGVFLFTCGRIVPVARPGDPMPGGGNVVVASLVGGNIGINNRGDVAFSVLLDSDLDDDGTLDTGLFQWSRGRVTLIARSGTAIPGVGTVAQLAAVQLVFPPPPFVTPVSGARINDRGQVVFQATMTDGAVNLLRATPGH